MIVPISKFLDSAAAAPINHLLRGAGWALERLKPFAGKTARFEIPPFTRSFSVLPSGEVVAAAEGAAADVVVKLTPGVLVRLAARDDVAWKEVAITGDTEFATALDYLCKNLRWDIGEDLSRVFGDIAAHRMVRGAEALDRWRAQAQESIARALAEYWTEEDPLLAKARAVEQFNRGVDALRDDVARFEKRIEHLASRLAWNKNPT